ncbi:hypothetical protein FG05_11286 [Fusarium graminearum]|nr:hypothetical protein FG05_11286 [Fusarium graminearum]
MQAQQSTVVVQASGSLRSRCSARDIHIIYQKRSRSAVSDERAARLVEIIDIGSTVNLRLVDGSIECTPYVALSYRWGGLEAVWQTTTSNLESRSSGFSIDELPKTLSNTVKVTHDLGFKWIWINSLCIVQDDKDDWAREAVKIAAIYQNAIVTVAADSSQDAKESEDNLLWMGRNLTISKIAHRVKSAKDVETKKQELNKVLYYWYVHLVGGDYSHRSLTYGEDKLVAIGGVAKALDDIESMGYMVGHWGDDDDELVKSLCWKRGGPGQKAAKYRAPSWSWASQDSIVDYGSYSLVGRDSDEIVAEPVTWQASAPDGTFFGRCTNAYLQIKAKFVRGTVFPNCGHDFSEYHQAGIGGDYTVGPPKERCAFLMLEGGETSDLVWLDESQATQDPVREGIDVKVVMLSEVRPEGEEPYPGACLICTLDERYYLTRIGFTEHVRPYKEEEDAPPVTGLKLCDKEAIELIII